MFYDAASSYEKDYVDITETRVTDEILVNQEKMGWKVVKDKLEDTEVTIDTNGSGVMTSEIVIR